jgi:NADH-quinone oxidoreductase subunit G
MLDQERCILCTRCVRFGDEITRTNDFGVFNRGDHSELDVYPGHELNNKYSGNVADICPVGALTDRDFRFKMRVWYLAKQKSVCPGCSRGCNITIEYENSRPYKSKKGRVMRLKPRENQSVNRWWMCDAGRYGYKSIDIGRLENVGRLGATAQEASDWKTALGALAPALKAASPSKWAVLVSPQLTNEDVFAVKRVFGSHLKWTQFAYFAPGREGDQDEFLIRADKNPNTAGTSRILGLDDKSGNIASIVEKAKRGELDGLVVFGHDLAEIFGVETLKTVRDKVRTLVYEGTNENPTAELADWTLPGASYAEKDGTFVNFQGRVQRIRQAITPAGDARPTYSWLADLAGLLGLSLPYYRAEMVFSELASADEAFKGMEYKKIGDGGHLWNLAQAEAPAPKGLPGIPAGARS